MSILHVTVIGNICWLKINFQFILVLMYQ